MVASRKPQAARQVEARSRARSLRVRVQVIEPARHYITRSQSDASISYRIDRTSTGWTCECQGFMFTGICKHLAQVERRSEREGWTFGKVATVNPQTDTAAEVNRLRGQRSIALLNGDDDTVDALDVQLAFYGAA